MNNKNKLLILSLVFILSGCKIENPSSSINESSSVEDSTPTESNKDTSTIENSSTPEVSTTPGNTSSTEDSTTSEDSSSPSENPGNDPVTDSPINVTLAGYSFESAYFQWEPYTNATSYKVFCDGTQIDEELIRKYPNYYRADILGLTASKHRIDIVPVYNETLLNDAKASYDVTPMSHIREGFAFVSGTSSGAYNDDGSLKANANVIYVDNNNKDTVSLKVKTGSSYTEAVGVQGILDAYKKGYEPKPLNLRFVGNITDPSYLLNGDIVVDFNNKTTTQGITIEGVGNDATFNGFGVRIKNSTNVEIRNLGFMNCNSGEGDNISLQQSNKYIWIHNNDLFYGHAGSDADQAKGDGALDTKTSSYVTHSFNHFWDSGKCNLQGMKDESTNNVITYHHNWYDHSDSRHPRVRTCTVHVYNNYFDGVSKYGVGATMGSSVFVENNYFRNTNRPMSISMQGLDDGTFSSEDGGIIKAYGNEIIGGRDLITYSENKTSFDYYDAKTRDEKVPESVVTLKGGTKYNNFDTASTMYSYNVQSPSDAKETVMKYAGRVQGGDFKWTFTNADDTDYDVNTALKAALIAYVGYVPNTSSGGNQDNNPDNNPDNGNDSSEDNNPSNDPILEDSNTLNMSSLTAGTLSSIITVNSTFTLMAKSDKTMKIEKGSATVEGISYTNVLKLEGKGNTEYRSIKINVTGAATIKVIAKNNGSSERPLGLLDSQGETLQSFASPSSAATLTYTVTAAGTYYIASLNSGINIYGIIIEYN